MASTNKAGFGSLASVAWTDMNGTGLNSSQLTALNAQIDSTSAISRAILNTINAAINAGWSQFSVSDIPAALRPGTSGGWAATWATQISNLTGDSVTPGKAISLGEWRRIAAELQNEAARQASKRSTSDGGGIKNANGRWFVNGQEVSLLDVYMAVRVNQVSNFDDSLSVFMEELKANNALVRKANDWLAKIRSAKPTDTSSTVTWNTLLASPNGAAYKYSASWGEYPSMFMPTGWSAAAGASGTTGYNYLKFETWIEEVKQYVSQKDTENQIAQQKLEQMTNRRSEVLEGLTSFIKAQSQSGQSLSRNLG